MNEYIELNSFSIRVAGYVNKYIYIYILKIKDFMNMEYFVKNGNCLFDFRRIRRIRRYKTFQFGSTVVEKDKILYLRSSFKVT